MKRLVVTADDVGLHRGMTEGAIRAHKEGIVTACSIVANGREFDHAVERLRETPTLEVGIHLTMVEERALTSEKPMPKNWIRFLFASHHNLDVELRAQVEKVLATGLRVTHINGHQHLHVLPNLFRLTLSFAHEYDIPYIRTVDDHGGRAGLFRRGAIGALNFFGRRAVGTNDRTIGVREAGHLKDIEPLLDSVDGVTELVTHPGIDVDGYPHWNYEWDAETNALCAPALRDAIAKRGIELVSPSAAAT